MGEMHERVVGKVIKRSEKAEDEVTRLRLGMRNALLVAEATDSMNEEEEDQQQEEEDEEDTPRRHLFRTPLKSSRKASTSVGGPASKKSKTTTTTTTTTVTPVKPADVEIPVGDDRRNIHWFPIPSSWSVRKVNGMSIRCTNAALGVGPFSRQEMFDYLARESPDEVYRVCASGGPS